MTEGMSCSGGPSAAPRKKFATPPVKIACLACRASRTRCDGGNPCTSCQNKARACEYRPSKRGGARLRRKPKLDQEEAAQMQAMMPPDEPEPYQEPLSVQNYIDPGAGLKHLNDLYQDSDLIFDSLFMNGIPFDMGGDASMSSLDTTPPTCPPPVPIVRTYKGDAALLEAYYIFIHPFFPVLPPPSGIPLDNAVPRMQSHAEEFFDDDDTEPSSSLALALSAMLALIPCPNDINHAAPESLLFRRKYAQFLAQSAFESIEMESEIPESSTEPQRALSHDLDSPPESAAFSDGHIFNNPSSPSRPPFHPGLPRELETIVALDILSVYEYAQRGNLKKMQGRAGSALVQAMLLQLHVASDVEDLFSEARRRVWWMTYLCACQASIVSNVKPTFAAFTPSFTCKYPTIPTDPDAYGVFLQGQEAILSATQFTIELNKALSAGTDMTHIYKRMVDLEATLGPLIAQAESWTLPATLASVVGPGEEVVVRALRCMARIKLNSARIKLHRYSAFFDLPIFSGKHCDLKGKPSNGADMSQEPQLWPSCACSSFGGSMIHSHANNNNTGSSPVAGGSLSLSPGHGGTNLSPPRSEKSYNSSASEHQSGISTSAYSATATALTPFRFSSHASAKVCLRSALNIAADFELLPYPNPSATTPPRPNSNGSPSAATGPCYLSPTSLIPAPRTMPSFACCAMQCAYSLLMVHNKTKALYPAEKGGVAPGSLVGNLLVRLQQGLTSISGTLENYATAFEALGGMRDQIRIATDATLTSNYEV